MSEPLILMDVRQKSMSETLRSSMRICGVVLAGGVTIDSVVMRASSGVLLASREADHNYLTNYPCPIRVWQCESLSAGSYPEFSLRLRGKRVIEKVLPDRLFCAGWMPFAPGHNVEKLKR